MGLLNLFKLEKLTIAAFTKPTRGLTEKASPASIEVMFNPTSYKRSYAIYYEPETEQSINSPGKPARYGFTPPGDLEFKLVFDGTGVDAFGVVSLARKLAGRSVTSDIEKLKDVCLKMNGDIHEPNYLKVQWGKTLKFECRLKSLDITYKLFDESGDPIRAEVDIAFIEDKSFEKVAKEANKNSPDLTHIRVVKAGDTLPLLCKEIYGSSVHYLQVARDNGLDDFRNLVPGQRILFAPLATGSVR